LGTQSTSGVWCGWSEGVVEAGVMCSGLMGLAVLLQYILMIGSTPLHKVYVCNVTVQSVCVQ